MSASQTVADRKYMRRALALAARGWGRVAPNPQVGAVVVREARVVGEGYHAEYGQPHAEVEALRAAGAKARGATIYVTLEPCAHHGKTPPCVEAVLAAGIRRLVFAAADPNPKAAGGAEILRMAGVEVLGGVESEAAQEQNAPFFHRHSAAGEARPWIELKLALSLDARVADLEGRSAWITGAAARAEVHRLRAGADAIAVGIGTALADDPQLTVRGSVAPRVPPVRVVFDRTLRLPPGSRLVSTAREVPVWVVCGRYVETARRAPLEKAGVQILPVETLESGLRELRRGGVGSLFCEGGGTLAGALLAADVVDRLSLFYAPLLLGPRGIGPFSRLESPRLDAARRWRHVHTRELGPDTLITLGR